MKCQGMHKFLLIEDWTGMGAHVSCLQCENTFHMELTILDRYYVPFTHFSGEVGPSGDKEVMILGKVLR